MKNVEMKIKKLKEKVKILNLLLEVPKPELMSWNEALRTALYDVGEFIPPTKKMGWRRVKK